MMKFFLLLFLMIRLHWVFAVTVRFIMGVVDGANGVVQIVVQKVRISFIVVYPSEEDPVNITAIAALS